MDRVYIVVKHTNMGPWDGGPEDIWITHIKSVHASKESAEKECERLTYQIEHDPEATSESIVNVQWYDVRT